MPNERRYHNLEGLMRDLKHAVEVGHQVAYDFAEVMLDVEDLVDDSIPSAIDGMASEPGDELDARDEARGPDASREPLEVDTRRNGELGGAEFEAGVRDMRDYLTLAGGTHAVAGAGCSRLKKEVVALPGATDFRPVEVRSVPRGTREKPLAQPSRNRSTPTRKRGKVGKRGSHAKK